ncbi:Zinc finger CCHC domain-containing protein 8 [Coemansia sp. RSA 1939]|nr:Zinc finger CCHC domain-containing protein 8 [Coemansia sp. RSA 1939]KAJ2612241.1 Zinc finger CCHC domain-containing protein 8 [Coemansia sp. RSA 1804]KAJ2683683.1 Zinc finger CCHC domain-containing protein 8 [Coemansia sp. RSA 1285]
MPDPASFDRLSETGVEQPRSNQGKFVTSERDCGRCSAKGDFLVYVEFGSKLCPEARRYIERAVYRVIRLDALAEEDRYNRMPRKRRRFEDSGTDEGGYERYRDSEHYASNEYERSSRHRDDRESNRKDLAGTKRKRGPNGDLGNASFANPTLVIYNEEAGFDLDTTRDIDLDRDCIEYKRGTHSVVGLDVNSMQGQGNPCFNCSMLGHDVRDCPMPIDRRQVDANRKAFKENEIGQFNSRLYLAAEEEKHIEEMRRKYQPGRPLSLGLREALGLRHEDDVPRYIDSMYCYGYPPAYLGSDPNQDPMSLRESTRPNPPPSPSLLHVYNDVKDYPNEDGRKRLDKDNIVDESDGAKDGSDEEGAIDECVSVDKEQEGDANGEQDNVLPLGRRNIPLVKYAGLDLDTFDFASLSKPGQPLRQQSMYQYMQHLDTDGHGHGPLDDSKYGHEGYRGGGDHSGYHKYYQNNYMDSVDPTRDHSGHEWGAMLAGYYNAAQPSYSASGGEAIFSRNSLHLRSPENPSHLPPTPQRPSNALDNSRNTPVLQDKTAHLAPPEPNKSDEDKLEDELEDGECDMEESE